MSVAASNRRERIRRADGTRTELPGGAPATGLSAIAACASGVSSLSGAARAAVYHDAITPHAEVTLGVQSYRDVPVASSPVLTSSATGYTAVMGPAVPPTLATRRDNAGWAPFILGASKLDDPGAQLAPSLTSTDAADAVPYVWRPATPLARLVGNPFALPAEAAWTLTGAPTDWNDAPNPSLTTSLDGWLIGAGVASRPTTGGVDAGPHMRLTVTGSAGFLITQAEGVGTVPAGGTMSLRVAVKGTVGARCRIVVSGVSDTATTTLRTQDVTLTASWVAVTVADVVNTTGSARAYVVQLTGSTSGGAALAVGSTLDIDQLKTKVGATTPGSYIDGASTNGVWYGTAHLSPSYVQAVPAGAYTRPTDAAAPTLVTADAKNVHRRTGALSAGQRMSSPVGSARYRVPAGRPFTVSGWVSCTLPSGGLGPSLRWVVDIYDGDATSFGGAAVLTLRSAPFAPPPGVYRRVSATLPLPYRRGADSVRTNTFRVHLEVVDPRGGTPAGTTLSVRGVQVYAGTDRGDTQGLRAVPVPAPVTATVAWPGGTASQRFPVTRVDVHGSDVLGMVTAASAELTDGAGVVHRWVGDSAGRLTMRGAQVDAVGTVLVTVEETNAGPGGVVAVQSVQAWREVDATLDLEGMTVDRSTDADPSSSTVPIGNYAASVVDLTLDDTSGEYALFGRSYLDLGHRIDTAAGVVYTNRSNDPEGVDAYAAGALGNETWPVTLAGNAPVVPTPPDVFGQVPPAAYCGQAQGAWAYDSPQVTTAPAVEGATVRGRVWVMWTTPEPPELRFAGAFEAPAADGSWVVAIDSTGSSVVTPAGRAGVWWLVDLGAITVPQGSNVTVVSARAQTASAGLIRLAAPRHERLIAGEVVEVVETAPAGVYASTSWSVDAPGGSVQVHGVDVLATSGDGDLAQTIERDTTVEAQVARLARRYLDLGTDQVVIPAQATALPYAFPVDKVATQLADLAKAGVLTAFTDGLGRLVCLPRQDVDPVPDAALRDDRSLVAVSSAITPDVVKNDVRVTVHPVTASLSPVELAYAGREVLPDLPMLWEPTASDLVVQPGETVEILLEHVPADGEDWQVRWVSSAVAPGASIATFLTTSDASLTITVDAYAGFARLRATAHPGNPRPTYIVRVWGTGRPLTIANATQRFTRDSSVQAFGRHAVDVDVRLAQLQPLAKAVGTDVLDNYALRDDTGERWLPDLTVESLGDPWRELGDRVVVTERDAQVSGEFRVLSHRWEYGTGAASALYLRRIATGNVWFVLDSSTLGGTAVLTY